MISNWLIYFFASSMLLNSTVSSILIGPNYDHWSSSQVIWDTLPCHPLAQAMFVKDRNHIFSIGNPRLQGGLKAWCRGGRRWLNAWSSWHTACYTWISARYLHLFQVVWNCSLPILDQRQRVPSRGTCSESDLEMCNLAMGWSYRRYESRNHCCRPTWTVAEYWFRSAPF